MMAQGWVFYVDLGVFDGTETSFFLTETPAVAAFSNKESVQKEVKATISQKATLTCNVSDSKTEVKWYKDGKLLISSRTIYSEAKGNTRQLVIEKVEKSDAGEYTCEAGGDKLVFKIFVTGGTAWLIHLNLKIFNLYKCIKFIVMLMVYI